MSSTLKNQSRDRLIPVKFNFHKSWMVSLAVTINWPVIPNGSNNFDVSKLKMTRCSQCNGPADHILTQVFYHHFICYKFTWDFSWKWKKPFNAPHTHLPSWASIDTIVTFSWGSIHYEFQISKSMNVSPDPEFWRELFFFMLFEYKIPVTDYSLANNIFNFCQ